MIRNRKVEKNRMIKSTMIDMKGSTSIEKTIGIRKIDIRIDTMTKVGMKNIVNQKAKIITKKKEEKITINRKSIVLCPQILILLIIDLEKNIKKEKMRIIMLIKNIREIIGIIVVGMIIIIDLKNIPIRVIVRIAENKENMKKIQDQLSNSIIIGIETKMTILMEKVRITEETNTKAKRNKVDKEKIIKKRIENTEKNIKKKPIERKRSGRMDMMIEDIDKTEM